MKSWPHAPSRAVQGPGTYMVTAGTYGKAHIFKTDRELSYLESSLLEISKEFDWKLEAWAVFPNHYHFIGRSAEDGSNLSKFIGKLHTVTSRWVNQEQAKTGRKVWSSYWQTALTYEKSYLARLNYVTQNPVHHGLVPVADRYPYCSAEWLRLRADNAWYETVTAFPFDRLDIEDQF